MSERRVAHSVGSEPKETYSGWNLVFERAIHIDPESGEMKSYWPEYWDLEKLAAKWQSIGSAAFGAGYQNDPAALDGNMLSASWLHYYTPEDLEAARYAADVHRGARYLAVDPAGGGEGSDPDYCAAIVLERIGHQAFGIGIMNIRLPIEIQAQRIEEFADQFAPFTVAIIEDIASRGYVYTAMKSGINGGRGTRHNFRIEKPQGGNAQGNKDRRFMSMGPRFEMGQIKIPGVTTNVGVITHPDWEPFVQEWKAYPSGHDDILDAMYWAQFGCFGFSAPIMASRNAESKAEAVNRAVSAEIKEEVCERPAHLRFGQPVRSCYRCSMEIEQRLAENKRFDNVKPSIGAQSRVRERNRLFH